MADNKPESQFPADLVPRLLRSLSKTQSTQQVMSAADAEQTSVVPDGRWMWTPKQKATAVEHHSTKLTHRGSIPDQVWAATDCDADPAVWASPSPHAVQMPRTNDGNLGSEDDPGKSPKPDTFAKRIQDVFSTIPSIASNLGSPRSTLSAPPPETEVDGSSSPTRHPLSPIFLTPPSSPNHGWQSIRSALDRLRPPFAKKPETGGNTEPFRDEVLDCLDDNNSVMMYGPLEPDDTSQVEIACSEIVSVNGDGEEIRTPQPSYSPLPSECLDEAMLGRGIRSPPPYFISLPLESIDQVLMGKSGPQGKESETEPVSEAIDAMEEPPSTTEPTAEQRPVKEYRVWLPSVTKISFQTMWWGFRIYLPPPVLDVLNNRQLEAAKRAALITTALQWLMDHLPISLLPPQMHPGVAILRYLVPYVGYMGVFIAWGWSAIRSFDKGYGVVLTATWLLPFILIPGTWEADGVPSPDTGAQVPLPVSP